MVSPRKGVLGRCELGQKRGNVGIVSDKPSIEISELQEALQFLRGGNRPLRDPIDLVRAHVNHSWGYCKAQKRISALVELTLFCLGKKNDSPGAIAGLA